MTSCHSSARRRRAALAAIALAALIHSAGATASIGVVGPALVALPPSWPEAVVQYEIDARLDVEAKQIIGRERVTWRNTTRHDAPELWFHLYQNAYKSADSTFLREAPEYVEAIDGRWGWIEIRSLRLASGEELVGALEFVRPDDGNERDFTVARVALPRPVPPGGELVIDIEFVNQLTPAADRTGYHETFYFVAQWFPKLGVFEEQPAQPPLTGLPGPPVGQWNCHQYHGASEYYADFGTYDVTVTLPDGYVFGSTGVVQETRANADGTTSIRARQQHVHDFAWTADPEFLLVERPFRWRERVTDAELARAAEIAGLLPDQVGLQDVNVRLLLRPEHQPQLDRHIEATFVALEHYGLRYGAYPYDQITIVDPSHGGASVGGMEYPTLVTAGTELLAPSDRHDPESVIVHEVGHQWWQGMVATNEFEESWLDEGINQYCEGSILEEVYGANHRYQRLLGVPVAGMRVLDVALPRFPFYGVGGVPVGPLGRPVGYNSWMSARSAYLDAPTADPMLRASWRYRDRESYGVNSYAKPEAMLRGLERYWGFERFTRALRTFHLTYRFKHPRTADFLAGLPRGGPNRIDDVVRQLVYGSGTVDFALGKVEGGDGNPVTVTVERRGEVSGAVEVLVEFRDGSRELGRWDGIDRWGTVQFAGTGSVSTVQVDPNAWYSALDADLSNNRQAEGGAVAVDRWSVEALFWFQNVLHELSLLS